LKYPFTSSVKTKMKKPGFLGMSRAALMNRIMLLFLLTISLILMLSSVGCSLSAVEAAATTTTTTTAVSTTRPPVTTTARTTTTTTPALTQTSFNLALVPPQTSAGYTLPVYLATTDTLHLVWTVSGVGENMRMKINTPGGALIEVEPDGSFVPISSDDPCDQLNSSGSLILKPSAQGWINGYYIFFPYICGADPAVSVKLMYWIEH